MFFDKLVGEKQQPDWVRNAKLRPVLKETGDQIIAMLPDDPEGMFAKWKARKRLDGDPSEPPAAPLTAPGEKRTETETSPTYKKAQQQGLQQLVETSAAGTPKR